MDSLQQMMNQMLNKTGTVFILSVGALCFDSYRGWYQNVIQHPGLIAHPVPWVTNTSAAVIIGCYKRCPVQLSGQPIPVVELGDDYTEVFMDDIVLDMSGKTQHLFVLRKKSTNHE